MAMDTRRCAALLAAGVILPLPALAGCSSGHSTTRARPPAAAQDLAAVDRSRLRDGGTLRWALDARPATFNVFQSDADDGTQRIAGAVLPALFTLDSRGRPQANPDYLHSAQVVRRTPRQVVVYRLNPKATWSDGRRIGIADFTAQWQALRGTQRAYGSARNAGYDRIRGIEKGEREGEIKVTFTRPYADWPALFSPLYPKSVMGSPSAFNDRSRTELPATAGPFTLGATTSGSVTLARDPRWWGERARLDRLVFRVVPREQRAAALTAGAIDVSELDPADATRIEAAGAALAPPLGRHPAATPNAAPQNGAPARTGDTAAQGRDPHAAPGRDPGAASGQDPNAADPDAAPPGRDPGAAPGRDPHAPAAQDRRPSAATIALSRFAVRKALEPAYTQLSLNGTRGPLADERVRRAVAAAIDRQELADAVLKPLGLPSRPLGSHLLMTSQLGYRDNSGALGHADPQGAQALLTTAGWLPGSRPVRTDTAVGQGEDGTRTEEGRDATDSRPRSAPRPGDDVGSGSGGGPQADREARHPGARQAVPLRTKRGRDLALRFVLPSGPGSAQLRTVGERIVRMLERIGVRTRITKVEDADYFSDHIASGDFDLALYSWPATAFPATDARPVFAKPRPAEDGTLVVEQNYSRVGTDQIDQLFEQASAELDEATARKLVSRVDARIWAAAGSIPLFQRPELVAVRKNLANVGAFGFATPRYQDIGFRK
ncbi:ABC transporter family substrate-binding protein [Streptomyces palmae]|uniref:ABC transporter family substrate-binding protein n=1 Tax=Streptomyces palmae TaxID=1701085 RepID=A0A4Z0HA32_9ACTN|nr:ABC transporter family substrate-binding protein [Streptomyces palmae]TGB09309.1 ABC transporter family substrate-binding protein [Streptomyces palmae]